VNYGKTPVKNIKCFNLEPESENLTVLRRDFSFDGQMRRPAEKTKTVSEAGIEII